MAPNGGGGNLPQSGERGIGRRGDKEITMRIRWRGLELPSRVVRDEHLSTETYGKFTAEPFERGFGTTVGNSLRRILLSQPRRARPSPTSASRARSTSSPACPA